MQRLASQWATSTLPKIALDDDELQSVQLWRDTTVNLSNGLYLVKHRIFSLQVEASFLGNPKHRSLPKFL